MTERSNDRPAKRPSFQWYPGDAQRDTALRACCLEARGLWREMIDLMHDGEPYGFLTAGGVPIGDTQLASLVGISARKCIALLVELDRRGVFSRTEEGIIYSRRMVRDGAKFATWRAKSVRGGEASGRSRANQTGTTDEPPAQPKVEPPGPPPTNTAVCSLQSASAKTTTHSPSARDELLRLVPNRVAWELEFDASKQGMHGPKATDEQIDLACREYLANGAAGKPSLPHWRGHLRRVVNPATADDGQSGDVMDQWAAEKRRTGNG